MSVVTVRSAHDAISTLRSRSNFFHLIVTDVHMPEMDGFEFQRLVHREFRLPVVSKYCFDGEFFFFLTLKIAKHNSNRKTSFKNQEASQSFGHFMEKRK